MNVAIVLFEGFDELDAIGPYEVFRLAAGYGGDIDTQLVTLESTARVEARSGLRVEPDGTLNGTDPNLLVVPGGGWNDGEKGVRREYERGALPDAIARHHEEGARIASVCTGALLLAKTGLLEGRPATTHHTALEDLEATGATLQEGRFVDDGDVLTAGGITSGFDLALHIVESECGEDVAESVACELEYERAI